MLVVVLAWRLHRRVFWWLLPFATGLFIATMYLRYHYVVDVLVSVLLLVPCVALGRALHALREGELPVPSIQIPVPDVSSFEPPKSH